MRIPVKRFHLPAPVQQYHSCVVPVFAECSGSGAASSALYLVISGFLMVESKFLKDKGTHNLIYRPNQESGIKN